MFGFDLYAGIAGFRAASTEDVIRDGTAAHTYCTVIDLGQRALRVLSPRPRLSTQVRCLPHPHSVPKRTPFFQRRHYPRKSPFPFESKRVGARLPLAFSVHAHRQSDGSMSEDLVLIPVGGQPHGEGSPLSPEQMSDNSFMSGSDGKFWRRHRSLSCPYCQAENPPKEAFGTVLSEHEAPPRRDSNTSPQKEMNVISAPARVPFAPSVRTLRESISSLLSSTWAGSTRNRGFAICQRSAMARRTGLSWYKPFFPRFPWLRALSTR